MAKKKAKTPRTRKKASTRKARVRDLSTRKGDLAGGGFGGGGGFSGFSSVVKKTQ